MVCIDFFWSVIMSLFGKDSNFACTNFNCVCQCQWAETILNNFSDIEMKSCGNYNFANHKMINKEYFWKKVKDNKFEKRVIRLYDTYTITLGDVYPTVLHMGIDPTKRFSFRCQIECKTTGESVICDVESLQKIFDYLNCLSKVNTYYPKSKYSTPVKDVNNGSKVLLEVSRYYYKIYKLTVGSSSIKIYECNLDQLLKMEAMIRRVVINLQSKQEEMEKNFFDLLYAYCMHRKKINQILNYSNLMAFFDEMTTTSCSCAPKSFIINTAIYFDKWFAGTCLPAYVDCLMLSEKRRLDTFRNFWPHKYLNIELLAKSGLYLIGPYDRVKCAFWKKQIEKWEESDNPVIDHYKFSPYCPLLNDLPTENEILLSSTIDLKDYIKKEDKGITETDCKENEPK